MHTRKNPAIRVTSIFFLVTAGVLAAIVNLDARNPIPAQAPVADFQAEVLDAEGVDGLEALKLFGDDADDLFGSDRSAFRDLVTVTRLNAPAREISAGPWRRAVVEWARSGRLGPYLEHLEHLGPEQWELVREVPACLPLLGRGSLEAEAMLARYGTRAWNLFLVVDFADDAEGIERVARALRVHGERMLRVNESHGPALALLLVPPCDDVSGLLPRLFAKAADRLGVAEAGALFLGNYDDLLHLALEERRPPEELVEAFDLLTGQREEVRGLASDSGLIVRLLLERRGREPIGLQILSRCGPEAADLLFEKGGYAGRPDEKSAALAILARLGWPGVELLRTFRDDASWHRLLRRADLMDAADDPLIVRIAGKLKPSPRRHDDIERYLDMPKEQIIEEGMPATFLSGALEWIPGYVALHTAYNAARGYHIETSEAAWAVIDGVMTASLVGELAGQAIKTVGRQAVKAEAEAAIHSAEGRAARELAASGSRRAAKTVMTQLPGALPSLTRSLSMRLPNLDVTAVMRSASGIAKKVGVRTWGRLDRRIIMRRDRRVVIDLFAPDVVAIFGEELRDNAVKELRTRITQALRWETASTGDGEIGPCIMERVVPGLSIKTEEWASERPHERAISVPPRANWTGLTSKLGARPVLLGVELASVVACLALAISRVRRTIGQAFGLISAAPEITSSGQRPRPYRE